MFGTDRKRQRDSEPEDAAGRKLFAALPGKGREELFHVLLCLSTYNFLHPTARPFISISVCTNSAGALEPNLRLTMHRHFSCVAYTHAD